MNEERLRVRTVDDGTRASIALIHPKGNILTSAIIRKMDHALDELALNGHLKLVTLEGDGADFSFGASIAEHAPGEIERALPEAHGLIRKLLEFPAPTAALVRGRCLGGGFELALACDFIFAEEGAVFGLPEIALGVFPPAACALLPLRVGGARATAAIVTGVQTPAEDWRQAGLVSFVSRRGTLAADVDRWFDDHLRGRSAEALRHAVAATRLRLRQDVGALLPQLERLYLDTLMQTEDAREGVAAFLEKRLPRWNDR
jgi:cyclohexa-1,5-dienecarbonyl-CoA hydratase